MKRKVIQHGPSSLIISLPNSWVKKYGVSKGDEIEVDEQENNLLISVEKNITLSQAEINISGLDRTIILYLIRGFYRLGYDQIKIIFNNKTTTYQRENKEVEVISVINKEVNRLIVLLKIYKRLLWITLIMF